MSYPFIDTTTVSIISQATAPITGMKPGDIWEDTDDGNKRYQYDGTAWVAMPHSSPEALTFNGVNLEAEVPGFKILNTSGRELMSQTVTDYKIGDTAGTTYRSRTYPSRTITVTYQLIAESNAAFRAAFNQLNAILDAEQVRAIFADEPDKFFIVTSTAVGAVPAGRNKVVSSFSLYCTDPHKYAVNTDSSAGASALSGKIVSVSVLNNGTVDVPIDYIITNTVENGYIAISNSLGETLAFGSPNEADFNTATKSVTLCNLASGTEIISGSSSGGTGGVEITAGGTVEAAEVTRGTTTVDVLNLTAVGSGTGWCGGSRTVTLSEQATDFKASAVAYFEATNVTQQGLIWMVVCGQGTVNNQTVQQEMCSIFVQKIPGSYNAFATCRVPANAQKVINFSAAPGQGFGIASRPNGMYLEITKSAGKFHFNVAGTTWDVEFPDFAEIKAYTCTLFIGKNSAWPSSGNSYTKVSDLFVKSFQFVKNKVTYEYDVPNRYQAGDVLTIDGASGQFYVNGEPRASDEILGSRYFKAHPGTNTITVASSAWATGLPTVTAIIREAWL